MIPTPPHVKCPGCGTPAEMPGRCPVFVGPDPDGRPVYLDALRCLDCLVTLAATEE